MDLKNLCTQPNPLNILIHGEPGVGKSELVRAVAAVTDHQLYEVSMVNQDGEPITGDQRLGAFQMAQQLLKNGGTPSLLCLDEAEDVFPSEEPIIFMGRGHSTAGRNKAHVNRLLENPLVTTIWISNEVRHIDRAYLRRFDLITEVKGPTPDVRKQMIKEITNPLPLSDHWIQQASNMSGLQPAHIQRAAHSAIEIISTSGLNEEQLTIESERLMTFLLSGTQQAIGNDFKIEKCKSSEIAPPYQLDYLNCNTDLKLMIRGMGRTKQGRICLYGPPGTGKSAFGRFLADKMGQPLLVKRASDLLDKYVGQSEENIAQMFEQAEDENAVLLLDEGDSFLRNREGAQQSWQVTQVNELLTQMESFEGIFILSTNLMESLDPAALRRFDFKLYFDYMDSRQRWMMFRDTAKLLNLQRKQVSTVKQRIEKLDQLTPGDFSTVLRKNRVMNAFDTISDLATALQGECNQKPGAKRNPIGFI